MPDKRKFSLRCLLTVHVEMKANFSINSFSAGPTGSSPGAPGKKIYSVKKPTLSKDDIRA